jgi:hypothetical protein
MSSFFVKFKYWRRFAKIDVENTTRPVGRPRTRWANVVQRDALQLLGITG